MSKELEGLNWRGNSNVMYVKVKQWMNGVKTVQFNSLFIIQIKSHEQYREAG